MITPEFVFQLESTMRAVANQEYQRLVPTVGDVWKFAKRTPMQSAKQRLVWMLDTAGIRYEDKFHTGVEFEELLSTYTEYTVKGASAGLEVLEAKLSDLDGTGLPGGEGIRQAVNWVRQVSAQAAYWPRKQLMAAINNGDQTGFTTYDTKKFFDTAHPLNVLDTSVGTFNNVFTGAASGAYPGACPIDDSVTLDVAFSNLSKVLAYIQGAIKMPNGVDPRMLKTATILVPERMRVRAQQLTNARFIAQAAANGGGAADVEYVVRNWGLGEPVVAPELGSAFTNGSDTSWYVGVENLTSDEVGALLYLEREPFTIVYNGPMTDAQLARASKLQWTTKGRNAVGYGHPYLLFKVKAS